MSQPEDTGANLISLGEAAKLCGVDYDTVYKWVRCGALAAMSVGPKPSLRVTRDDVLKMIKTAATPYRNLSRSPLVYLIRSGDFVKIGCTSNLRHRMTTLSGGMPHDVAVLAVCYVGTMVEARQVERSLHVRFAKFRHRGEWFHVEHSMFDVADEWVSLHGRVKL